MPFTDHKKEPAVYAQIKTRIAGHIDKNLKESRRIHTYAVVEEAKKLAVRYGEDPEKAEVAALFHDMFRGVSKAVSEMYGRQIGLPKKIMENPNLSHGKIAAFIMRTEYGIEDRDILNAVAFHTTGRKGMSTLEKVIFLADAIEPGRNYPSVEEARSLAYTDLNQACICSLTRTIEYIRGSGAYLDPDTLDALKDLKEKLDL